MIFKVNAGKRLLEADFIAARPSLWFRVEVLTPKRPIIWCRRRDTGLFDLFNPSPKGPFREGLQARWLMSRVRAIRDTDGQVMYANPQEQRVIQSKLTQYLRLK